MNNLSAKEVGLLDLIQKKSELQPAFFRKARGEKWFPHLSIRGFFSKTNMPAPRESKEPGYFTVPRWHAIQYLVNNLQESPDSFFPHVQEIIEIIVAATEYAKSKQFSNYQVWWQFSEIICHIPAESIPKDFDATIDYWLDDPFNRGIVSEILGTELIPKLLEQEGATASEFAIKVIGLIFKTSIEKDNDVKAKMVASIRADDYHLHKIIDVSAYKTGSVIGLDAVNIYKDELRKVVEGLSIDSYSYIWQSAIEDHEQNQYQHDVENLVLKALRESLHGYLDANPSDAEAIVSGFLDDDLTIFKRIAIYLAKEYKEKISNVADLVIKDNFLDDGVRHEMWHFLNSCYGEFSEVKRADVLASIEAIEVLDENETVNEAASSYKRAIWLSSIKEWGEVELVLYKSACTTAKTEPDHPDFLTYMSVGDYHVESESPYSVDELASMSMERLLVVLVETSGQSGPKIEGIAKILRQVIRDDPMRYWPGLERFAGLDPMFVHAVIEAYAELWELKSSLPWDAVWSSLLGFIGGILTAPEFWLPSKFEARDGLLANSNWIVSSVARLFRSAVKDDSHSVSETNHESIRSYLVLLLDDLEGSDFSDVNDAVSLVINSSRGLCLDALINLALRECRLEDKLNGEVRHPNSWAVYQPIFEKEVDRLDEGFNEFSVMFGLCFLNFKYISNEWTGRAREAIFGEKGSLSWVCGIQGLGFINKFDRDLYYYLRDDGHFFSALDSNQFDSDVKRKLIQYIAMGFLSSIDEPDFKDSITLQLIDRFREFEISELVRFIYYSYKEIEKGFAPKVCGLLHLIARNIDRTEVKDRKIGSDLSKWLVFETEINDSNRETWELLAHLVGENHNEYEFLKNLAKLSEAQPFEANNLWQCMIKISPSDYPVGPIKEIFERLVAQGNEGIHAARVTVSEYLKKDVERPNAILEEILNNRA